MLRDVCGIGVMVSQHPAKVSNRKVVRVRVTDAAPYRLVIGRGTFEVWSNEVIIKSPECY